MRAPISVIIPTLNAETCLGACLASLMPGVEAGLIRELIVTDGGSTDATVEIAKEWGAEVLEGSASRGAQLARGCRAAQGDWLLVLHADTRLNEAWVGPVAKHLRSPDAAWFRLAFEDGGGAGRMVAAWANLRSRMGLPYGDQGLLVPATLYARVGGYPNQPLMEDVAIARALKGHLIGLDVIATTSAARYKKQGWLRRGARNLWTLIRYFAGTPPQQLAQSYRG
ncbi:TIGR04283 family arsenosugar biosynthesis glycosyltransferase [Roseobacter litoralis]|uniref:Glycosyltransferase, family 2 n=1 Tax=Roseobacter litoralis (strain ATCC 49566 / DSM 6996 / JCM 21268 / NBRC 15278 / OCh 149) TaxID=391595 RepID=F7ZHX8_ROSLO|nr:TIGR04283 family arsenosugar biosynthesis glycosyltransferase [Roseobacter litoralis]AEI94928.1 putative glycosyltransferase, family 2 [Roseobacter litoralis Och 149]